MKKKILFVSLFVLLTLVLSSCSVFDSTDKNLSKRTQPSGMIPKLDKSKTTPIKIINNGKKILRLRREYFRSKFSDIFTPKPCFSVIVTGQPGKHPNQLRQRPKSHWICWTQFRSLKY